MKKLIIVALMFAVSGHAHSQDKKLPATISRNIIDVSEGADVTEIRLSGDKITVRDKSRGDTVSIRIGRRTVEIIGGNSNTSVNVWRDDSLPRYRVRRSFNGHWAGFEMGINTFHSADYSLYDGTDFEGHEFMDLRYPQSVEVSINFLEHNIAFRGHKSGIVTGIGFTMNNYKFADRLTIVRGDDGIIQPVEFPDATNWKKSKLLASYFTVPLLFEFQFPVHGFERRAFFSAGVVGAVKVGSHTKVRQSRSRDKNRDDFNINPFKAAVALRAGVRNLVLYGNYGITPFFEDGRGPELYPLSIGICIIGL